MFEFLSMIGTYDQRKVGRDDFPWGFVSTAEVNDSDDPYETAVEHHSYGDGNMVIVETYATKETALAGHVKWVKTMTAKKLPERLVDKSSAGIAKLLRAVGGTIEPKALVKPKRAIARRSSPPSRGRP